jgi:hypothetical protein
MKIKSSTYCHIHRTGHGSDHLWIPGQTFNVGGTERNEFIKYYDTARIGLDFGGSGVIPMNEAINKYRQLPDEVQKQYLPECLQIAGKAIREMATYIREAIFEEVRQAEYPLLPSRMKGAWVCEEKDIQYWLGILHSGNKKIFRVSLAGILHCANPENLVSDTIGHNELREYARRYWKADDIDQCSVSEILFEGSLTVLEQIDEVGA